MQPAPFDNGLSRLGWGLLLSLSLVGSGRTQSPDDELNRGTRPDIGIRFQPNRIVALTNARVVVDSTREVPHGAVLIIDGRIAAVGKSIDIPPGAERIDCQGDSLYPAFIDAMVEWDTAHSEESLSHWNPSITPQRGLATSLDADSELSRELRQAGIGVALAVPKGKIIKGQSCLLTSSEGALADRLLHANGFQHIRLYPDRAAGGYPNSPMGATALVRQVLSDANWYQDALQAAAADPSLTPPERDPALAALQPVVRGEQAVIMDGTNELYALRCDRLAREFSLRAIIRGSGREYRRLEAIAATNRTYIIPVDHPSPPEVATPAQAADATLQELLHWKLAPGNAAALERAGVHFVLTSDGLDDRSDLLAHVRQCIEHGLEPQAALAALTERPAELLGIANRVGTLERGKLANILRVQGDLFKTEGEIKETWVQGMRYPFAEEPAAIAGNWNVRLENSALLSMDLNLTGKRDKLRATLSLPGVTQSDASNAQEKEAGERDDESAPEERAAAGATKLQDIEFDGLVLQARFDVNQLVESESGQAQLALTVLRGGEQLVGSIRWPDGSRSSLVAERRQEQEQEKAPESATQPAADAEPAASELTDTASPSPSVDVSVNYPLGAYGVVDAPQAESVLFRGATIWTCGPEGVLTGADLLVHDGSIQAVGQGLEAPQGCRIVDAQGLHISPGIIDCHSHMATDGGVNESGQAVTAEVRIGDFIDPNDIHIYRQLAGGVTTSNILHGSANPIGGQNQVIKLRWGSLGEEMKMREAPAGIKFALGENVKQSNRSSSDRSRYPQSRMGVEQILRDRFAAALLYRQQWEQWSQSPRGLPPRRDYELEAIAEILEGTRWIHCHSYRQDEILATLRVLDDYGVTIGSFQHILEGYKVADAMAKHGATGSSFSDWWAYKFEVYDAIPYNGALMHDEGVIVSFNSDDRELARHLNHEAAKAVKYGGVPEHEALKFVTLNPAKQLRIDQWVGSLEVGKHADFVVWNGSPLSTLSACQQTWVDGRKYFDRQADLQRRQQDAELHRKLVQAVLDGGEASEKSSDDDPSYWWARYDEFCHHHAHEHDEHEEETHHEH